MNTLLAHASRATLDVFFPRSCVACGDVVEHTKLRHICAACEPHLALVKGPHCATCGHPFYGEIAGNDRLCPHCEELVPEYRSGRTAVLLKGPGRALIHALKYHHGLYVLEDITALMARVPDYTAGLQDAVLVPVPLHPRKQRERGYNQSLLLAECLAEATGGTARVEQLLQRVVDTVSQTQFDRRTRQRNLKNAFALAPGATLTPTLHYVLIDDVFTTGSTLNACAALFRRAGCLNLDIATFGHG